MATARLASAWPTMNRSSSETISRGVKKDVMWRYMGSGAAQVHSTRAVEAFDHDVGVGVDANLRRDLQRTPRDLLRRQIETHQRARRGQRIIATGTDADDT